ncbi:MAG: SDR family oxidoreductase [Candidatus Omnitrophica bacterium]|nr:SDR family oxidoreductase [Candidatus Omnitrophota bacterium]
MVVEDRNNIFITGATGFLGIHLIKEFLQHMDNRIYVLVRGIDSSHIESRKNELISHLLRMGVDGKISSRITAVSGDITCENLGLRDVDLDYMSSKIDTVYHCAAVCNFGCDIDEIRNVNVKGTERLLKLTLNWHSQGRLKDVNHISTVYVAGNHAGRFHEDEISVSQTFNNTYEQSKFEAELAVDAYRKKGLPVTIYRPSIIIDTIPPTTHIIPGLVRLLAMFILELFPEIPADEETELNLIPVDDVAKIIHIISNSGRSILNQNYHVAHTSAIKLGTLLNESSRFFGFKKPKCIPVKEFRIDSIGTSRQKIIGHFTPYLNQRLSFDMRNTLSILEKFGYNIPILSGERLMQAFEYYRSKGISPSPSTAKAFI